MRKHLFVLLLLSSSLLCLGQKAPQQFREDGTYIIAHFNDTHFDTADEPKTLQTYELIRQVLRSEQPDVAIFNGDIVTDGDAKKGWTDLLALLNECQVPFVINSGNHDPELLTRDEIWDLLLTSPYFIGEKGPRELTGIGNIVLPIVGKDHKAKALLYCLDSNDYYSAPLVQYYDWIHFDQIAWYREQSSKWTAANGGTPLPALMFFHIPLPEFESLKGDITVMGKVREGVSSPVINSGLYSTLLDMRDVMGVFVGHDHNNDAIGIKHGIALGYGKVSGISAYGDRIRGALIIKLYEGQRKFDSWLTTPAKGREGVFYYPAGISSDEERDATYLPSKEVHPTQHGVAYSYYEGAFRETNEISADSLVTTGKAANFAIDLHEAEDHFAYKYRTYIKVPERGVYRFYTFSDDGSVLYIDGQKVVDNDGSHSMQKVEGKVALEAGFHLLELHYFEDYMGQKLEVGITARNIPEQVIPAEMLYLPE